ncbi:MAG: hypothetical protein U9Q67_01870 [Patescibacteria group bacterium]|nr:hypothetical protein [Patescibacteria group bacterium]
MASFIMPLPMLVERLGFVEFVDPNGFTEENLRRGGYMTRLTVDFSELIQLLREMFNGNVRFGFRMDWVYRQATTESVLDLFRGPLVPRSENDEERIAEMKEWLLEVEARFANLGCGFSPLSFLNNVLPLEVDLKDDIPF